MIKQSQVYQSDIKQVFKQLPEGMLIFKRFGNPHVKLYNDELVKLFGLELPEESSDKLSGSEIKADDLPATHL